MAEASVADLGGGDEHHYQFGVKMSCGGCSGAVERVLKKMDGTHNFTLVSSCMYEFLTMRWVEA